MNEELIINLAPTGMVPTRADSPHVPLTPGEVAADVRRCADVGASIVHVHPRDAEGVPTSSAERAAEFVRAIRELTPQIVIGVTTSGRIDPRLEARAAVLELDGDVRPEMASLTLGSLNFPKQHRRTAADDPGLRAPHEGAENRAGVGDFRPGHDRLRRVPPRARLLAGPVYANILLGSLGTLSAAPLNLAMAVERLPTGSTWAATGTGRFQLEVQQLAIAMGGHVRVGLEDNLWYDAARTDRATNPRLVERLVAVARAMGREPASPAEVRQRLGMAVRFPAAALPAAGQPASA